MTKISKGLDLQKKLEVPTAPERSKQPKPERPKLTPEQEEEMQRIRKALRKEAKEIWDSERITAEDLSFIINI